MTDKAPEWDHEHLHKCFHAALKVSIKRDDAKRPVEFSDVDPAPMGLFRGTAYGEGHADRLLDDYLCRTRLGATIKDCGCTEYRTFLRKERQYYGYKAPPLSLRGRLLKLA